MSDPKQHEPVLIDAEQLQSRAEETAAIVAEAAGLNASIREAAERIRTMNERYASLIHALDEIAKNPNEVSAPR